MSGSVCIGLRRFFVRRGSRLCRVAARLPNRQQHAGDPDAGVDSTAHPTCKGGFQASGAGGCELLRGRVDHRSVRLRLHDISGQMLWFWAVNHRLPEMLDELRTTADPGTNVDYTCPVTHKQYGYAPGGWQALNQPRRLVVYDSVPNPDGSRWAILIGEPKAAQPLATWVVKLPEMMFRSYLPPVP